MYIGRTSIESTNINNVFPKLKTNYKGITLRLK